jgi:hypothetical protein|tara:strand:- start:1226 stop:1528 length:303 start_codon:yes stop_codon:yes gene_type:complete
MKLMTKEIEKKIPNMTYESNSDSRVYAKYFHPMSSWTWYALEYDPETKLMYGWVDGDVPEYGSFSLQELEEVKIMGMGIERDKYWDDTKTIGQVIEEKSN